MSALIKTLRWQQAGFTLSPGAATPFYAALCEELVDDVSRDGAVARVLAPYADAGVEDAYVLRLLAAFHRLALTGDSPDLAAHFPSTGGDGDVHATMAAITDVLLANPPAVADMLSRPPQTNEVGRAAALASGLLVVADRVRVPLCLREIGTSAGLNLRLDEYWYQHGTRSWGRAASPVRFVDLWNGGAPPFEANVAIADRRGCDRNPIDVTDPQGALALLSYVWPEPRERFERARAAIDIAARRPVALDRADAGEWIPQQLVDRPAGTALVVFHSVMWQYLDDGTQSSIRTALTQAGEAATADAPLAWLRLEPTPTTYVPAELRLTLWNGASRHGDEMFLGTTGFHGGPLEWRTP
jgi:hypothetical protein